MGCVELLHILEVVDDDDIFNKSSPDSEVGEVFLFEALIYLNQTKLMSMTTGSTNSNYFVSYSIKIIIPIFIVYSIN